jgi:heat shock protein HslJ
LVLVFGCLVALAGCRSAEQTSNLEHVSQPQPSLEDQEWQLVDLGGKAPVASPDPPTLRLDGTKKSATGSTSVNRFTGAYELKGDTLVFKPLATTRRAGPPELMAQETTFLQALRSATGYRIARNQLILLQVQNPVATFKLP